MIELVGYAWTALALGTIGFFLWPRTVTEVIVEHGTYVTTSEVSL